MFCILHYDILDELGNIFKIVIESISVDAAVRYNVFYANRIVKIRLEGRRSGSKSCKLEVTFAIHHQFLLMEKFL